MKYARIVPVNDGFGVVDLFTTDPSDDTTPMKIPEGASPLSWLNQMFSGFAEQFAAQHAHFREVAAGVKPGAVFLGSQTSDADALVGANFVNADGTDGNGNNIPA